MPGTTSRPFADSSIWNTRIGSGAIPVHAGIPAPNEIASEQDVIVLEPASPARQVWQNNVGWSCPGGGNRCIETSYTGLDVPIPDAFVVPDECPTLPNSSAAFLMADGVTLKEFQPMARCTAGGRVTRLDAATVYTSNIETGDGIAGSHGGSGMSALGGVIRLGELVTPGATIAHALKILLDGDGLSALSDGFRWPADHADTGFQNLYRNPVAASRMGALYMLLPSFNVAALNTEPARIIARTLQEWGAYVVDLRADDGVVGMAVERGPDGLVTDEFFATWGFDFDASAGSWYDDMSAIYQALHVVDNNAADNVGGGGPTTSSVVLGGTTVSADAVVRAIVGGSVLAVKDASWTFGIGQVPTATLVVRGTPPAAVRFDATVTIDFGFTVGDLRRQFTGRVKHIDPSENETTIECMGYSYWLDAPFHETILTFQNVTMDSAITTLLQASGVPLYQVTVPAHTFGTVALSDDPDRAYVQLTFQSYGEAISKIGEPLYVQWFELPSGAIVVRQVFFAPAAAAWRTYFSMQLDGYTESYPAGVTSGRPRLRRLAVQQQIRDVKNKVHVRGVDIEQVNADGSRDTISVEGTAQQGSPWVLNFNGSQAYNEELFQHELIDTPAFAAQVAQLRVEVQNRLYDHLSATIDGDPDVEIGRTVAIIDPDYSRIRSKYIVAGYTTRVSAESEDCSTTLDLIGGPGAGGEISVFPFAVFTHATDRQVIGDRVWAVTTLDASASFDLDGSIVSYSWADNDGWTDTGRVVHVRKDAAAPPSPWIVTLTVTDDQGNTDDLALTIGVETTDSLVFVPAMFVANDAWFSASPDGGISWNDQAAPGGDSVISSGARPGDGSTFGVGYYGTSLGAIYRTSNYCASAPTLAMPACGSPIVHLLASLWALGDVWAVAADGRLFRSQNDGVTWTAWDDMRTVTVKPGFTATFIGLPFPDGIWVFGGDGEGRPVIYFDPDKGHHWASAPLGGELLVDLLTNPVATDLRIAAASARVAPELAILLTSTSWGGARLYYTENVLGDGSAWRRALGLPAGKTDGRWITDESGAFGLGQFQFGFADEVVYLGDLQGGTLLVTTAPGALAAGDVPNYALSIGQYVFGIQGSHIVCAEGATDGTLYKTWDRFTTNPVDKLRDAAGFPANPAGANAKMIAVSTAGSAGGTGKLRMIGDDNRVYEWNGASLWTEVAAQPVGAPAQTLGSNFLWFQNGHMVFINLASGGGLYHCGPGDAAFTLSNLANNSANDHFLYGLDWSPGGTLWAVRCGTTSIVGGQATKPFEIHKSLDYGETWTLVFTVPAWDTDRNHAVWSGFDRYAIACDKNNPNVIVAVCRQSTGANSDSIIVVYTEDGGASWTVRSPDHYNDGTREFDVFLTGNDEMWFGNAGRLFLHHHPASGSLLGFLLYSDDLGGTWNPSAAFDKSGSMGLHEFAIPWRPGQFNNIYMATNGWTGTPSNDRHQVLVSRDNGLTLVSLHDETTGYRGGVVPALDPVSDQLVHGVFDISPLTPAVELLSGPSGANPTASDITGNMAGAANFAKLFSFPIII